MGDALEVLVTGGNGNLGSWISDHLASLGHRVTILARTRNAFVRHRDYAFIQCDLSNEEQVREGLAGRLFDHVVHLSSVNETAIPGYGELALRVNALGTRNLLVSLDKRSLKGFQYFSTFHVYGKSTGHITEETRPDPRHEYATTHLFAEHYVRQFHATDGLPYVIWRLSNSYGAPKYPDSTKWYLILNDLSRMAFEEHEIRLKSNGRAQRDFIWMGTVCGVVASALGGKPLDTVMNLGSGKSCRMLEVAHAVRDAYHDRYGELLPVKVDASDTSRHEEPLQFDCSRLQASFPHRPDGQMKDEALKIFDLLEQRGKQ